jgi:putative restriction endonuclease
VRNSNWSRDQLIVAFNLYCRIPFGKIHILNPEIISLAKTLGRTPSALSWKLANFASLDPSLKARKISGAKHGSKLDKEIWDEFIGDWERLSFESEEMRLAMENRSVVEENEQLFPEGKTRDTIVRTRVNQGFFRAAVLAAYNSVCCITGLTVSDLLIASHIVPWSKDVKNRTNPRNGLCLNAIHDRAFDLGLITITSEYEVAISPQIRAVKDPAIHGLILQYEHAKILVPERFAPDQSFLEYHQKNIFNKSN